MNIDILHNLLIKTYNDFAKLCKQHQLKLVTAESCTAGMITSYLTDIAGSSEYIEGGFVTYSNNMKESVLNISSNILKEFGAVSEQVAIAMATNALRKSINANISVAVTGIAGPNSDDTNKPVGLVWIAGKQRNNHKVIVEKHLFSGNRQAIRLQTAIQAIELLKKLQRINLQKNL